VFALVVCLQVYVLFPVELQVSVVQVRLSLQFGALPRVHAPLWQLSFWVQPLESALHAVPLVTLLQAVVLIAG
jgi:hypothetical protein